MVKIRPLSDSIKDLECNLAKQKAVLDKFPDAICHPCDDTFSFSSKQVNQIYNKLEFHNYKNSYWATLHVTPYFEFDFEYNGTIEKIKVSSKPKRSRLAYTIYRFDKTSKTREKFLAFSRLTFNMKNNSFKDDMLIECQQNIMKFITDNPKIKLDIKHLDKRLKKLLAFI
ncbi:hypothetical protein UFOVP1290_502 [uncultured Caudovirales phage]|uniref:Uncharacterized protein n=1 Tax=uncultured Caudovirales phage TaxID=2100421 RepID=A0A6J5RLP9_9CAUD|nr:hypothetical protein UFOVP1290_502 [uncultured Caudovirales phage]